MRLWSWESEAGTAAGSGLSDDQGRALGAAEKFMADHGADSAVVDEVMLLIENTVDPVYVQAAACRSFEGRAVVGGQVRWRARRRAAA